jgi:hypothetical protein
MADVLGYTEYDFDTLVIALQNRLKTRSTWIDLYRSGTGEMLIELLAYVLNAGLYYTERRAEESYLQTAKNRSSVIALVSLLNYIPKRKTSATGVLTFSIAAPLSTIVYIPKYTECQSVSGKKFVTNESAVIEKGQTSVQVSSIQGELKEIEVVSNGTVNQEYLINSVNVEDSASTSNPTLRVLINSVEWTKVDSFINSTNISKHFRVINEMEGTVTIKFGDNVNGKAPSDGDTVLLKYIESDGLDGNVAYASKITTINDTIYDETPTAVTVTVTNTDLFLGGDAEEDIEEIRYEAPRVFKTGDRAVTKEDFISIIENTAGVATANVWGENEEASAAGVSADYEMLNKVKMCIVLQEWELPGTTFKAALSAAIYDKSMLTVKYEFVTPTVLDIIPTIRITAVVGSSLSTTQDEVEAVLAEQFTLGTTTKLGTKIKYSNILAAIDDLDNVAYTTMDLEIYKALSSSYDSYFEYGASLDAIAIRPETTRLFVDGTYVTVDVDQGDGTGSFDGTFGSYTISNSSVDYVTGEVLLDINPNPSSSIHVRYQQDENDNLVPAVNHICKLKEVDVVSIAIES